MSMDADQAFEMITVESLREKVGGLRRQGYRLVQIGATRLPEQVELTYSFDREGRLANLRLHVPAVGAWVPSITSIYWCAFLYENELHDLFNVRVDGLAVDFHGHLYETTVKFPFGSTKAPAVTPAAASAPAAGTTLPAAKQVQPAGTTERASAGVRPSSGAATSVSSSVSKLASVSNSPEAAALGDERTPVAHKP